ncbi:MAG: polysaccharide deacetylase family protein, partial [Pyrinomonadaceae bacterium]|nr:polysaccharide deacetylase family protein [Pyrinomonadaceae bacterium]
MRSLFFYIAVGFVLLVAAAAGFGQRTIAVTIDDLPVVSTRTDIKNRRAITRKLLGHIAKYKVPAIGFVNENKLYKADGTRDDDQVDLLRMWTKAGLELGNHTYSHRSLHAIPLKDYQDDVLKGATVTSELLALRGAKMRYFRHPYLQTGRTLEIKAELEKFLDANGYTIAPITVDNADYIFSRAYDIAYDRGDKKLMQQVGEAYVPYMESKLDYWERQSMKLFGREVSQTMLLPVSYTHLRAHETALCI